MDLKELVNSLHPLERQLLPHLGSKATLEALMKASGMQEAECYRAMQWLEAKGIITTKMTPTEVAQLDVNGERYASRGLPEKVILQSLIDGPKPIEDIQKITKMDMGEIQAGIGIARGALLINFLPDKRVELTSNGKNALLKDRLEDAFLKRLSSEKELDISRLEAQEKHALETLRKRKQIVKTKINKTISFQLTSLGKQLAESGIRVGDIIDNITPEMLASGGFKGKQYRTYDVTIPAKPAYFGRKQHYKQFLDEVRKKFVAMGFSEMSGPLVETDFWDMDALYMPQFHSARDIHQAYYIKEPTHGQIDESVLRKVKAAHENGGGTGSRGWRYTFDVERTKRLLLRTQTTACSARKLASKDLKIPGKYFAIAKNFRYDVIDATHLPDFFQTEGIVVEEGLSFRHLKGLLLQFAKEFAKTDEVRIKPGYFPFTEPSCELFAKHPDLGWVELGGAGIFRPELTKPLGVDVPVIAWGLGIDRIGMFNMGIKDIRALYSQDLAVLRNIKVV